MKQASRNRPTRRGAVARLCTAAALGISGVWHARAHTGNAHAPQSGPVRREQKDWGIAGHAKDASRSIAVAMSDDMRFTPGRIDVRQGETLKFIVRNRGKLMHEFVIGTQAENAKHAEMMVKHPNMEHDEPYMAHVPPGKTGEIVWKFNRAGLFEFACLIAGHYQAGMVGSINVVARGKA